MSHLKILPLANEWKDEGESRLMRASQQHYFYADRDGIFEPAAALGDEVGEGNLAGTILIPETPAQLGTKVLFPASGIWICAGQLEGFAGATALVTCLPTFRVTKYWPRNEQGFSIRQCGSAAPANSRSSRP